MDEPHDKPGLLNRIFRYLARFGAGLCALLLFFWPWLEPLAKRFGISLETVVALLAAAVTGILVDFDILITTFMRRANTTLTRIENRIATNLTCLPLSDAIRACIDGKHDVNEMRIFALTTAQILPIMKGLTFKIATCYILLPRFVGHPLAPRESKNNTRVEGFVAEWKMLQRQGRITTLEIRYYDHLPSHYCCIFDDSAMLIGTYTYRDWNDPDDVWNHEFGEPLVIVNNGPSQALVIDKITRWFDGVFHSRKRDSVSSVSLSDSQ
jgi:hypothetical protein